LTTTSEEAVLSKIKHQPYFSLRLIPESQIPELTFDVAKKLVFENRASLRGWDFPHVDPREVYNAEDYVFSVIDWNNHLELWRMYLSGQFIYIGNLWDVLPEFQEKLRREVESSRNDGTPNQKASIKGVTSFIGLIYSVTEFYVFAARLSSALSLTGSLDIKNTLHNVEDWVLGAGEPAMGWYSFYQSKTRDIELSRTLPVNELVADPKTAAVLAIKRLFEGFNWNDASPNMIRGWQDKLMSGRFAF